MHGILLWVKVFLLATVLPAGAQPTDPGGALASAFEAIRDGDWVAARSRAGAAGDAGVAVVEWTRLRNGNGSFDDYLAFLDDNGDWPGLDLLREKGEATIPDDARPENVIRFFDGRQPETGAGALALADAFRALGRDSDADIAAVIAWRTLILTQAERRDFLDRYADLLVDHHEARLDMLLWRGVGDAAEEMFALVDEGWQTLARARIALRRDSPGVDALIELVPDRLAQDAGLAYERFNWRVRRDRDEDAIAMLLESSIAPERIGEAERWAPRRRIYARAKMREGAVETAYEIASRHHLSEGSNFADLEWLAGYLALRFLDEPALALDHFQRFDGAVWTPISKGRAAYWMGRAHEALGDDGAALDAYTRGAAYQQGFYGQLAAEKAGAEMDPRLAAPPELGDWADAGFAQSKVFEAALLFLAANQRFRTEQFLYHLAETVDEAEVPLLAAAVRDLQDPHLEIGVGKAAAFRGVALPEAYFPMADLGLDELPVPRPLALAIARRESEFDPVVVSPAGALGLMQLMPGTAQMMAGKLGVGYSKARLTADPVYNATLGSAYLSELIDEFGAAYPLVAAGYNAGPGRPRRWIELYGDPRSPDVDPIDWIEHVPFTETRNYIMRVMEALTVYEARVSGEVTPLRLFERLRQE